MRRLLFALVLGFLITTPCLAANRTSATGGSGGKGILKTYQTTSYQNYDDGYYQKGISTTPRFVDNGDGTINDNVTGLQWVKQPSLIISGASVIASNQVQVAHGAWATEHNYVIGDLVQDAAGVTATASVISAATAANPCVITVDNLNGVVTGDTVLINGIVGDMGTTVLNGNRYYVKVSGSALTLYTDTTLATGVNTIGKTYTSDGTAKQCMYYVTASNHTSGTLATDVTDGKMIKSVWTASAANLTTPATRDWSNSIINCEALVYAGFSDWRLPNLNELQSLANYGTYSPAINGTFFPNTQSYYYWSGTTFASSTGFAWGVYFSGGNVSSTTTAAGCCVRPVRSSQ